MAVESKDELQKMTIPNLKEKLKQRRMPISGTKPELVNRLHEALQEEEALLNGSMVSGLGTEELDVDDLLGSSLNEYDVPSKNEEDLLLGIQPKEGGDAVKPEATIKPSEVKKTSHPKPIISMDSGVSKIADKSKTHTAEQHPIIAAAKDESKAQPSPANNNGAGAATETSAEAKPSMRPKISVDDLTGNTAKKRRAERFGITINNNTTEETSATKAATPQKVKATNEEAKKPISMVSNEKLMERAKRFGLPVSDATTDGPPKAKAVKVVESDSKLEDRKKRFGL